MHILTVVIADWGALTVIEFLLVSLFFSWLLSCPDQATCAQQKTLGGINRIQLKKFVSSGPNISKFISENTYQYPWRLLLHNSETMLPSTS